MYNGGELVAEGVPCLLLQEGESVQFTPMGAYDANHIVMILEPGHDVTVGDMVTDDATGVRYVVVQPASTHRNPLTFEAHHMEVLMERYQGN